MMEERRFVQHPFGPVFDGGSEILILGTFPSVKSREGLFYYHHPQNRFWRLIAQLCRESFPQTVEERRRLLLRRHIALWDVIESCELAGSSDASIKNVRAADLSRVLGRCQIRAIFGNGAKACELYARFCEKEIKRPIRRLPSTSPANASWTYERLLAEWSQITAYLNKNETAE